MKKIGTYFTRSLLVLGLGTLLFPLSSPLRAGLFLEPERSEPPSTREEKRTFESCRRDAQKGDPEAMGNLGLRYAKGLGTPRDAKEAFKWLRKAARKGDAPSQNNLGFLYLKGQGVERDEAQALAWFEKAAAQGLPAAQKNLGLVYGRGMGVPKDLKRALIFFKQAAEWDDTEAQVNLGMMLSLGQGGPKDPIESYKWFTLALKRGHNSDAQVAELRDNIEWLEKRMEGKDVAEAKKRADQWKPVLEKTSDE